jgi:L-alanine-DL-glutamate epimerase-like enolase superfamily enzyme
MNRIDKEMFNITGARITILQPRPAVIPFQDATMGPFHDFGLSVLTLTDANGISGEVPVFGSYNNILETCLLPILLHSKHLAYPDYTSACIGQSGTKDTAASRCYLGQVDLALHDLAAKKNAVTHKYLGSARTAVTFYGSGGTSIRLRTWKKRLRILLVQGLRCINESRQRLGTRMEEDVRR